MHTLVAVAALTTLLTGASTASYAASRGEAAHGAGTAVAVAKAATTARKAPTARIVRPGERVVAAPGFEFWMTAEGKHAYEPVMSELVEFQNLFDKQWGAWYVLTHREAGTPHAERLRSLTGKVTVYDKEGTVLVSRTFDG
ncbi:hypothetical protein P1P68_35000 [Streptomyces scabiei]|uniref:hypothetical protein n=1 Tax=Streptomyces scabiei TaxID=1930 RepID=UPI00298FA39D|nr:hypothetical protein [Streptomyces scabiei]MDW8809865.1 hypothetical protein [Streptomyces scabiei]